MTRTDKKMKVTGVKPIDNAKEAAKIMLELMETPQIRSLHFEFEIGVRSAPTVEYTVERLVIPEEE